MGRESFVAKISPQNTQSASISSVANNCAIANLPAERETYSYSWPEMCSAIRAGGRADALSVAAGAARVAMGCREKREKKVERKEERREICDRRVW